MNLMSVAATDWSTPGAVPIKWKDSFPSWGLKMKTGDPQKSTPKRFSYLSDDRSTLRNRSILIRLPYDHSAWLGKVIAEWAGVALELCPNPDGETAENPKPPET